MRPDPHPGVSGALPARWQSRAWRVPGHDVTQLTLSADGSTLYWLRSQDPEGKDATSIAALTIADGAVRLLPAGHPVLAYRPVGDRLLELVIVPAPASACTAPPCQAVTAQLAGPGEPQPVPLAQATATSLGGGAGLVTSTPEGALFQLPQQGGWNTYYLPVGASTPRLLRRDPGPLAQASLAAGMMIGQQMGRPGLTASAVQAGAATVPLPVGASAGGSPVGHGTALAWEHDDPARMSKQLVISLGAPGGGFAAARPVPTSDDYYNVTWVDDCHLLDREADGLYYLDACAPGGVSKQLLLSVTAAQTLINQARFDSQAGRMVFAVPTPDQQAVDLVVLQTARG